MEIPKDAIIFSLIEKYLAIKDDNNEFIITFNNKNATWTENEFNNFTKVMRSFNFKEIIDNEFLTINNFDNTVIIKGLQNIIKYCSSNNHKSLDHEWIHDNIIIYDIIDDLFDIDLNFSLKANIKTTEPDNWEDMKKRFIIYKNIKYIDNYGTQFIASIIKFDDININENKYGDEYYTLKQSQILKNSQHYEFKIIFNKNDITSEYILSSIIKIMQSFNVSSGILSLSQQKLIINQYYELVKNDIEISSYNKKSNEIPLLMPKPVTLEQVNLLNPDEYGIVSILSNYTVTEKADGERMLLFINNKGNIYIISNNYRVEDTGLIASSNAYNSLIDGEFIHCNKRKDNANKGLFAAFDIYYIGGKKITNIPLIDSVKESRYNHILNIEKLINNNNAIVDFMVKKHYFSDNILNDADNILKNYKLYPYEIDGLVFTPAKLALYSYYTNNPVTITDNQKWDRVFKWKPSDQNTIDFLVKIDKTIMKNGLKYREAKLFVGYNESQWEDYTIEKGLKLRYDKEYYAQNKKKYNLYVPVLFRPINYYTQGVEIAHIKETIKNDLRCENGDKIESDSIIEFKYINNNTMNIHDRWIPIRVREDKTRIYKRGQLSKTANDISVALNIWSSIHNPVTTAMITGNENINNKEVNLTKLLQSDDIYYSRNIPRNSLLSYNMMNFHNICIKKMLYDFPKDKATLLELAGGQGGDMNRWVDSGYKFILSIDLVKNNIYNSRSGAYSRLLRNKANYMRQYTKEKAYFPDIAFACGDCSVSIKNGQAAAVVNDKDSEQLLKTIMNPQKNIPPYLKYIVGKGVNNFSVVSIMFGIHYMFENEDKLNGFLNNVSSNLKKGGYFIATFMSGEKVKHEIEKNGGDLIEGRKLKTEYNDIGIPVWAIIRRYNKDSTEVYGQKIDVYLENTNILIPEYIVNWDLLLTKCNEYGLELHKSEMFEDVFNRLKKGDETNNDIEQIILEMDKDDIQKQFSFLNKYVIFKKK